MKRILRICSSKELPKMPDRDTNYLYLCYDKLWLFSGHNAYYDPFVICDNVPEFPIQGYLYILFNGTVKSQIGDELVDIAEVEDESQLDYLKVMGTTYFIMADKRYLDLQYRILQLPYHNGTYSMNMDLAGDLKINNKTIVRYDQETEEFYIEGDYLGPPHLRGYNGAKTKSVEVQVNNHCIHADIRLSSSPRNMLKIINGGLYINTDDKASIQKFNELNEKYKSYKAETSEMMTRLEEEIESNRAVVSKDSILEMVKNAVKNYYSDIDNFVKFLDSVEYRLKSIEIDCKKYTDDVFKQKCDELIDEFNGSTGNIWGSF